MKIVVDPLIPSSITTTFYGPTTSVEFYRDKYREGISEWNPEVDIYRNFSRIFGKYPFVPYGFNKHFNE